MSFFKQVAEKYETRNTLQQIDVPNQILEIILSFVDITVQLGMLFLFILLSIDSLFSFFKNLLSYEVNLQKKYEMQY